MRRLVERFYQLMDELPEARAIRSMHPPDLGPSKEKLFQFLSGWLGGPPLYAERYGPPRLQQKHLPFPIDAAARDAWMACMNRALEEQVSDAELRARLAASLFKTADFLRNQLEGGHDHDQRNRPPASTPKAPDLSGFQGRNQSLFGFRARSP